MPESQLALSWDNFQQTMQSGIFNLLENEDLVDVTFCVEGKKLKGHRMILSVCSPFFKDLFETNPCQHPIIFLNDVKFRVMKDLLTYMYKGEVLLTQELLPAFVRLGESLQIRGLTNDEPVAAPQQTNEPHILNQHIFADTLAAVPIHSTPAPAPKAPSIAANRRPMTTTRPPVGGVRRSAASSIASNATLDSNTGHLPMKRPKLAVHTNKPRFILEGGKLSKVIKVNEEDLMDEVKVEAGHVIDDLSQLDNIQHTYSYTPTPINHIKHSSTSTTTTSTKQRRKSTNTTSSTDQPLKSTPRTPTATIIDPMEMELAIIHQGLQHSDDPHEGEDSEDDDTKHQVIIGSGGDIILEEELDYDEDDGCDMDDVGEDDEDEEVGDMDGEEVEHKLLMETEEGEDADGHGDGAGSTGEEDFKEDGEMSLLRTIRKQEMPRYIVDGFVFHVNIMKGNPPMTYLRCLEYKRLGCHARAVMPTNGSIQDIQLTQMHNHPPDFAAEEKIVFMRELKDFLLRHMKLSTKEVYDLLQPIYPTAAHETPYESIKNKMSRWKRSFILDNEMDLRISSVDVTPEQLQKKCSLKTEIIIPD